MRILFGIVRQNVTNYWRINMGANEYQVGGEHYKKGKIQHWDYAASNNFDYFQGQVTKYVSRWKDKNGIQDLEKAKHFLEKYIELERCKTKLELPRRKELPKVNTTIIPTKGKLVPEGVSLSGQSHPFGWNADREFNGGPPLVDTCSHPLAGVLQNNIGGDI